MENLKLIAERSFNESFNELSEFITSSYLTIAKKFGIAILLCCVINTITFLVRSDDATFTEDVILQSIDIVSMIFCTNIMALAFRSFIKDKDGVRSMYVFKTLKEGLTGTLRLLYSIPIFIILYVIVVVGAIRLQDTDTTSLTIVIPTTLLLLSLQLNVPIAYGIAGMTFNGEKGLRLTQRTYRLYLCNLASTIIFTTIFAIMTFFISGLAYIPMNYIEFIQDMLFLPEEIVYTETSTRVLTFLTTLFYSIIEAFCTLSFSVALFLKYGDTVEVYDNVRFIEKMKKFENL